MFLKIHQLKSRGGEHRYASLVETTRTEKGPRQRAIYYLRELNASARARSIRSVEVFDLSGRTRAVRLISADLEVPKAPDIVRIRVGDVSVERARQYGSCYVGWHLWKSLRLDRAFPHDLGVESTEVPWSKMIGLLTVYRLCVPASRRVRDPGVYSALGLYELQKFRWTSLMISGSADAFNYSVRPHRACTNT